MKFRRVSYQSLNGKQQEIYNFQKVAGVLADYGFNCIKLADDWLGADFLAYHKDGAETLKVQLKSRLTISKKYLGKGLHITFPLNGGWCLIEHDTLVGVVGETTGWLKSPTWDKDDGQYHSAKPSRALIQALRANVLGHSRTISDLFHPMPSQWGFRGDPHLWQQMADTFSHQPLPIENSHLIELIEREFRNLTGYPISTLNDFNIEKFDHGGMSGGMISPKFWRDQVVPMLLKRLNSET